MNYRERLGVPGSWWVIGMFFAVTFVTAVGFYAGPAVAAAAGLLTAAAVAAALLWYGRVVVAADEAGLHAGESLLEWAYVGEVKVLDRAGTRHRLGSGADHAAWLVVRGFVPTALEVEVADPADPHPYWVVSTRRPAEFAAAVERLRSISPAGR